MKYQHSVFNVNPLSCKCVRKETLRHVFMDSWLTDRLTAPRVELLPHIWWVLRGKAECGLCDEGREDGAYIQPETSNQPRDVCQVAQQRVNLVLIIIFMLSTISRQHKPNISAESALFAIS